MVSQASTGALPSSKHISDFYDEHTSRLLGDFVRGNRRVSSAIQLVLESLDRTCDSVLDVGCGIGASSEAYAQARADIRVHGVDISPRAIEIARTLFSSSRLTFSVSEMATVPRGAPFSLVALLDVYEHVPRAEWGRFNGILSECLASDGTLVLTTPSPLHQRHLRDHRPGGLQIVDETVDIADLVQLGRDIGATLTYFTYVDVWSTNQYVHAVFRRQAPYRAVERQRAPSNPLQRLTRAARSLLHRQALRRSAQQRRALVHRRLGVVA